MFEKLKRKSIRRQKEKNLREREHSEVNTSMTTLGFIVDESVIGNFEALYEFAPVFGLQRKNVRLLSFLEVKRKIPTLRQNQVHNKEFSWKGEIRNQNACEFLETPFDVLVCLYAKGNEFIEMMAARSKAHFKVSTVGGDSRIYDLIIALDPKDIPALRQELKKYLTILRKVE